MRRSILLLSAFAMHCGCGVASPVVPPEPANAAPSTNTTEAVPAHPAATATVSAAPTVTPDPVVSATAAADAPSETPPAAEDAPPPASSDRKAFVTGPLLGTDVVFLTVADASETCASVVGKAAPAKGAKRVYLRVLWTPGYYDFSNRMAEGKLATYEGTFWLKEDATRGGVRVRSAPVTRGGTGRIHVTGGRPGSAQSIDAELDVVACVDIPAPKPR